MKDIGWSKPKRRPVPGDTTGRRFYEGMSHLLVVDSEGATRSRCGVSCDTESPPASAPPVKYLMDICARCSAPYAKHKRRNRLSAPKVVHELRLKGAY